MCYGHLDPKHALRETEARLGAFADDRKAEASWWTRLPGAVAQIVAAIARPAGQRPAAKEAQP